MTEQTTTNLPAPVETIKQQLPVLLEKSLPLMEKWSGKADAALDLIVQVTNDEEREDANDILSQVRDVYKATTEKRKEMTDITDAFKDLMMEYERPLDPKAGAKSKYNEKRRLIEEYDQQKLEKRRRDEAEAAKKKELENLKVDYQAKMLENLTQMLIDVVKRVDAGSKSYFEALTLENFDTGAEKYKNNKPKLKPTDYDACFVRPVDPIGSPNIMLMSQIDYARFVVEVQQQETFDKWNTSFVEAVAPVINEWRAKIPDLKANLIAVSEAMAKSQEEAERVKKEQQDKADREAKERQDRLDTVAAEQKQQIQEDASMNKMSNEFAAQAAIQNLDDVGGHRPVLKFTDPKKTPKAFMEILYHCFSHADFPGIQKRDKAKKLVVDSQGRPEYIEPVQWWIDFFLKNCDAAIDGTQEFKDAKTTIRK
jgi:hypothetical protein